MDLCQHSFLSSARFVRQTGGHSFAIVVAAWFRSTKQCIENAVPSSDCPPEYFSGFREGVTEVIGERPLRVVLVDAVHHPVDSSLLSFRVAGRQAAESAESRLTDLDLFPGGATAEEIRLGWMSQQKKLQEQLAESLCESLPQFRRAKGEFVWSREGRESTQCFRLRGNSPNVPVSCDFIEFFRCTPLLDFLQPDSWGIPYEGTLGEFGTHALSRLCERSAWSLETQYLPEIVRAQLEVGLPFLDRYQTHHQLADLPGYVTPAIRGTLLYMSRRIEEAKDLFESQRHRRLGNPVLVRASQRVFAALADEF